MYYTKERIIEELKRIAQTKGGKPPTEQEFEHHSTIPISTLRFHLGSWKRALEEAGLVSSAGDKKIKKEEPKSNDELLLDLIRLYVDCGEFPTPAMIQAKGKYTDRHYRDRWKSIAEAFQIAKQKFPEKLKSPPPLLKDIPPLEKSIPLEKTSEEEFKGNFILEESVEPIGEQEMNQNNEDIKAQRIKFIPQTIKPKKAKPKVSLEPIDFRGLAFAPATKQGLVYLFGMISQELGFVIESFITDYPDCEGKRCVDEEKNQWERVRIQLEYKSSDFKARSTENGYDETHCDLIICWSHDWEECPFEVLELKSTLQFLPK